MADLFALLFALFVLLVSFAEIDTAKFAKHASPIRTAFNNPISILPESYQVIDPENLVEDSKEAERERWRNETFDRLQILLTREIQDDLTEIEQRENEIIIRFPDTTAFASGTANLKSVAKPIIDKVGQVLGEVEGQVAIGGHTDDVPISTAQFRSNWDLSSARAVSVVHYLLANTPVDSARVTAQGFADSRPLRPNDSPANRSVNRRVEIAIQMPDFGKDQRSWMERLQ